MEQILIILIIIATAYFAYYGTIHFNISEQIEPKEQEILTTLTFCKNCGNKLSPDSLACLSCGCDPNKGNKHCHNCGVKINSEQIICIKCGSILNNKSNNSEGGTTVAIMAYITIVGFIIAVVEHNSNKTKLGAYHLRQVLGFMLTSLTSGILLFAIMLPGFSMDYRSAANYFQLILILSISVGLVFIICLIISFLNAIKGKEKPAPILGILFEKLFGNMFI